jgi:tripartite-type tricarboxylate transporter receptor subunit TctC
LGLPLRLSDGEINRPIAKLAAMQQSTRMTRFGHQPRRKRMRSIVWICILVMLCICARVASLIDLVKANPGKYTYGSSGVGSILHLCGEQFKASAGGLNVVHVPYRGSAPMMGDLIAGQISMAFDATPTALPQAQSGAIRAIGTGTAARIRALPNLPTLQEQGLKGFECYTWNAILAPANTPSPIVVQLNEAMSNALADPVVFDRLQEVGIDPTPKSTPEQAAEFIKAELAKWAPIIRASGAEVN